MISMDSSRCLGCFACSNVCPSVKITREDGEQRVIRFSRCEEFCDLCVEFCPGEALSISPEGEDFQISFELIPCRACHTPFATRPMLRRIIEVVPEELQKDSEGISWVEICPRCRREMERERAARPAVRSRM
ncbi:MAG: 4Fe-4S dicluster domain-containing protein [Methanotrichaceae archaeon]|nr:4Fe-4S dicluster domain-containing protein [Methanotrichaceae archaeon]